MAKIHSHYDNLKVARLAPPEVIRAAYKALSQKYHPDKNPGDEKAARIMAILNSAYGILSDPERRREHDEWITAEEWEIDWLESTRGEEHRDRQRAEVAQWEAAPIAHAPIGYKATRDPKWWMGLALCFSLGCVAGILMMGQSRMMPVALATALGAQTFPKVELRSAARSDAAADAWAVARPHMPDTGAQGPDIKTLAVMQLVVPARAPDCDTEIYSLIAPNGEPWPSQSGYVDGFPVGNQGAETQLTIDNTENASPVLVKVYDLDRRSNVRHVYVLPHDSIVIEKLAAGKYEVRYQNIDVGGTKAECLGKRKRAPLTVAEPTLP